MIYYGMVFKSDFLGEQPHVRLVPLVFFVLGIVGFFADFGVMGLWLALGVLGVLAGVLCWVRDWSVWWGFFVKCAMWFVAGVVVCQYHVAQVDTVFLKYPIENAAVSGEIVQVNEGLSTNVIMLEKVRIKGVDEKYTPQKIRISVDVKQKLYQKGDVIWATIATLYPPAVPSYTRAYYQAREYYFKGIGASGFALRWGLKEKRDAHQGVPSLIDASRQYLKEKITPFFNDDNRGIIGALIWGDKWGLNTTTRMIYKTLGLSHILSISGFHISLLFGVVFICLRYILALFGRRITGEVAKRYAALLALGGALFYVMIAGAQPPAVRAFFMVALVVGALFIYRGAVSLYSVMVAGVGLLCFNPVLVVNTGFQLSFMAVFSLVVLVKNAHYFGRFYLGKRKIMAFLYSILALNVIVWVSTLPFILYRFHQVAVYSVVGNFCFAFLFSLVVLPLLVLGVVVSFIMPAGGILGAVDMILAWVQQGAMQIAQLPGAMVYVKGFDSWGLVAYFVGIMWLVLLVGKVRWLGFLFIGAFFLSFFTYENPDMLIARQGRVFAVRDSAGQYHLSESYFSRSITNHWLTMNGQNPDTYYENQRYYPDLVTIKGKKLALSPKNCQQADITFNIKKGDYTNCPNIYDLTTTTPLYINIKNNKITIKSMQEIDKNRPWGMK